MLRACVYSGMLVATVALGANCGAASGEVDVDKECGRRDSVEVFTGSTAAQLYTGPAFTTSLVGNRRKFNWSGVVENICSANSAKAEWEILVHKAQLPPGWPGPASSAG